MMPLRGIAVDVEDVDILTMHDRCAECRQEFTADLRPRHQCAECNRKMLARLQRPSVIVSRVLYVAMTIFAVVLCGIFIWHAWPRASWDDRAGMILTSILAVYLPRMLYLDQKRKLENG